MTLFFATLLIGVILILKGITWNLLPVSTLQGYSKMFLRNRMADFVFFGSASVWFLWKIAHLGAADFGEYRNLLLLLFGSVAVGCFIFVRDFLAVRGWSILILLLSTLFLDAAYMQEPKTRLFMVGFVYLMILMALYFGTVPYKMRDFLNWVFSEKKRVKTFATIYIIYGLLLTIVAFTY